MNTVFSRLLGELKDAFIPHKGNGFRPGFLHGNLLLYIVGTILVAKLLTVAMYLPLSPNYFFADITKIDLLNLLNQHRQNVGLNTLSESEALNQAAALKAQDMVNNGYFAHQSPTGVTPWFWFKKAGYEYKYAGENLAVGFFDSKTVYDAWVNSPSHKANLLNKNYTQVGTAVVTNFEGNSILVVQEFGSPLATAVTAKPKTPAPTPKPQAPKPPVTQPAPQPSPEPAVVQENPNPTVTSKVLSQTTEYFVGPENAGKNTLYLKVLNFVVYDNARVLQYLAFFILLLVVLCLGINGILMQGMQNRLILARPVLIIIILALSIAINTDMPSQVLIHQITI